MNVYAVPPALEPQYRGAGHALAVFNHHGVMIDFEYAADLAPAIEETLLAGGLIADQTLRHWYSENEHQHPRVIQLKSLGTVKLGALSCFEFCELP